MNAYRQKSAAEAKAILESGIATLDALTSSLSGMPYKGSDVMSQAETAFMTCEVEKANEVAWRIWFFNTGSQLYVMGINDMVT